MFVLDLCLTDTLGYLFPQKRIAHFSPLHLIIISSTFARSFYVKAGDRYLIDLNKWAIILQEPCF